MTKLKKILIVSASFVLVAALAVVGVLAATQQSLTVTSTVSFQATGVNATAEIIDATNNGVAISGITTKVGTANAVDYIAMQWNQDNNTASTPAVFNLGALSFVRNETAEAITFGIITFKIKITNNGGTTLTVGFTEPTIAAAANVTAEYAYAANGSAATRATMTGITNGNFALITVTLTVTNPVKDVPSTQLSFAGTITPSN